MVPSVFEDEQTVEVVLRQLRNATEVQARTGAPWFVAAGFRKPHLQWRFPERFLSLLPGDLADVPLPEFPTLPDGAPDLSYHMPVDDFLLEFMDPQRCGSHDLNARNGWAFPDECQQQWRRAYWASVSYMDSCVGEVLAEVDRLGAANDTIVVFFGDHGWHLGEFGIWEKFSNFEVATRTPLIIRVPPALLARSQAAASGDLNGVVQDLVELVDVFPTLVELAGFPPLSETEPLGGKSLMRLMLPPTASPGVPTNSSVALSQFPRCVNGLQYYDPLREGYERVWRFYGMGQRPPSHADWPVHRPTPRLPFWDLNDCNDVNRTNFTHMGLSMRTREPFDTNCSEGCILNGTSWRLTIWYEWDGIALAPDWESKFRNGSTSAMELYDHTTDDFSGTGEQKAFFDSSAEAINLAYDDQYRQVRDRLTYQLEALFGRVVD